MQLLHGAACHAGSGRRIGVVSSAAAVRFASVQPQTLPIRLLQFVQLLQPARCHSRHRGRLPVEHQGLQHRRRRAAQQAQVCERNWKVRMRGGRVAGKEVPSALLPRPKVRPAEAAARGILSARASRPLVLYGFEMLAEIFQKFIYQRVRNIVLLVALGNTPSWENGCRFSWGLFPMENA